MQHSPTIERLRTFAETAPVREMHEAMRLVAERLMGPMRPVPPPQTEPDKSTPKRKPGGGRKPSLTPEQIEKGIGVLRSQPRMKVEAARETLRKAGINTNDTSLYELVIKPTYAAR